MSTGTDNVKIGIVGSKFAADFHCDAYSRIDACEVVAVAAIDNLQEISRKWNIPTTYTDYNEMFEREDLDLVSVCVPNHLHHPVTIAASNAGLDVVCEKPLAITIDQGQEMVTTCKKNGTRLFYAEDWLSTPALKRAKELIDEGAIGKIMYVKAKEVHNGTHSAFAKSRETCGGGSFIHLGAHCITYLLYLLGNPVNPIVEVTGKMNGGGKDNFIHKDNTGEDFGMGMLRFKNGEFGFVEGNYITHGGMDDKVEIYGTEGVIKVDLTFSSAINCYSTRGVAYSIEKQDITKGWTKPAVDEFYNLGYVTELAYFVDCVRKAEQPFYGVNGEAGLATIQVIDAFYRSNAEGKTIYGEWL